VPHVQVLAQYKSTLMKAIARPQDVIFKTMKIKESTTKKNPKSVAAAALGSLGGKAVSRNKKHMARIGRKGAKARWK
jgi:hypothetical protein